MDMLHVMALVLHEAETTAAPKIRRQEISTLASDVFVGYEWAYMYLSKINVLVFLLMIALPYLFKSTLF